MTAADSGNDTLPEVKSEIIEHPLFTFFLFSIILISFFHVSRK